MIFTAGVGHQNERSPRSTSPMAASSPRCAEAARKNSGSVLLTLLVSGVKPIATSAKELSISECCLRNWLVRISLARRSSAYSRRSRFREPAGAVEV